MSTNSSPQFQFHALPNGITLHAAHWGDPSKPLMIFMHGFPEFWFAWRNVAPHFADRYHCVAPDLRGFNLSSMPQDVSEYKAHKIMQDMLLLVKALGKDQAVFVSHDWGGAVAWSLAIAQTQKLIPPVMRAHISINSPHPATFQRELATSTAQQDASRYMLWLREPFAAEALAKDQFHKVKEFMLAMTPDRSWFTAEVATAYEACWARGLDGGLNYYRATPFVPPDEKQSTVTEWKAKAEDLQVRIPTHVIWGENDTALLPGLVDGLDKYVASLSIHRYPKASHWICHESATEVCQSIDRYLTRIEAEF